MVIEDDSDISNMICDFLKQNGYNARPVYSGTEALMVFNNKIDLVLLDLMLPGLAGEVVLQEIRKQTLGSFPELKREPGKTFIK